MAMFVTEAFLTREEHLFAEEDSKNFSICGKAVAFSIRGERSTASINGEGAAGEGSQTFSADGEGVSPEQHVDDIKASASQAVNSKRVRQFLNQEHFKSSELDVDIWTKLDDNLLEKVIARLPFNFLFQASSLSTTWRDRFCCQAFHREVQDKSPSSWKSYAPLFVSENNELVGYESSSKQLHRLPTHSYLPQNVGHSWKLRSAAGSLLCWICRASFTPSERNVPRLGSGYDIHITNPLRKCWKQLPSRPEMGNPKIVHICWETGSKGYKVIVGALETLIHRRVCIRLQIFDSTNDSWAEEYYNGVANLNNAHGRQVLGGSAFIKGILYMLVYRFQQGIGTGSKLISFDVKKKIWKEAHLYPLNSHHLRMRFYKVYSSQVLVCGSNVMLVIQMEKVGTDDFNLGNNRDNEEDTRLALSVFRLDLECSLAFELATAPDQMLHAVVEGGYIFSAAGEHDYLYIGGAYPHYTSIQCNVGTREWHWLNPPANNPLSFRGTPKDKWPLSFSTPMSNWLWSSVTYQPGLNPFFEV